jgi:hypothetical protein
MAPRKHLRPIERLIAAFTARLTEAMGRAIDARARTLAAEWAKSIPIAPQVALPWLSRAGRRGPSEPAGLEESSTAVATEIASEASEALPVGQTIFGMSPVPVSSPPPARRGRPRRERTSAIAGTGAGATSAPVDLEQQARHAELAHLRAVLKPTAQEAPAATAVDSASVASTLALDSPADPMRALEDEVREQMPGLAQLSPAGCTAQLAAWAGRVRAYEEGSGNRIAARLLLDKLRALAHAMEAGRVEALSPTWRTSDWPAYVERNQALAGAPPPARPPAPSPSPSPSPPAAGANDADDPLGVWR